VTPASMPSLVGLRVAVTGASGFCGAVVARRAEAAGADVVCLGRRPGPVGTHTPWDATCAQPDLAGADVVVHLAAAVGDPGTGRAVEEIFRAVNVDGSRRLLDAAHGRPVVWVSSASVYDPNMDRHLVREDHPVRGQLTAYGRTKAAGEQLALDAAAVVLRPRAVYGDGDRHLLPRIRRTVRAGVALLPGPDVRLSLTAVDNLADACLAAHVWPGGAYNIADAEPYWRDATIRAVLAATGNGARLLHVPLPLAVVGVAIIGVARPVLRNEPVLTRYAVDQVACDVVLDITKARAQGWQPRVALSDFLATLS
jgi:nucleoside-diphosphate-sugar epimerase